jgi:putative CocE/NonD family hydrolase
MHPLMQPEAITFEAGANEWRSWSSWPPRAQTTDRNLYVRADAALSFEPPPPFPEPAFDRYVSDPAHPVPYRHRPIPPTYFPGGPSGWSTWLFEDQRFVDDRPDVLTWETAPLADDLTIAGPIVAHLFASTSGSDSDWIVKLIDVYPENYPSDWKMAGYELMVANEVFRGRYGKSFEKPEPIAPNAVVSYTIGLHTGLSLRKGHRIMIQVQSTWFHTDRSESADVRAEHLRGAGGRLPHRDTAGVPVRRDGYAPDAPGGDGPALRPIASCRRRPASRQHRCGRPLVRE